MLDAITTQVAHSMAYLLMWSPVSPRQVEGTLTASKCSTKESYNKAGKKLTLIPLHSQRGKEQVHHRYQTVKLSFLVVSLASSSEIAIYMTLKVSKWGKQPKIQTSISLLTKCQLSLLMMVKATTRSSLQIGIARRSSSTSSTVPSNKSRIWNKYRRERDHDSSDYTLRNFHCTTNL